MRFLVLVSLMAAGCGLSEKKFVAEVAQEDCEYALSCWSDAALAQNAWESVDDCLVDHGPEVAGWVEGCGVSSDYRAKQCVKFMNSRGCAQDGPPGDLNWPEACVELFASCEGDVPVDTDGVQE